MRPLSEGKWGEQWEGRKGKKKNIIKLQSQKQKRQKKKINKAF